MGIGSTDGDAGRKERYLSIPAAREGLSDVNLFLRINAVRWNARLGNEVRPDTGELGKHRDGKLESKD